LGGADGFAVEVCAAAFGGGVEVIAADIEDDAEDGVARVEEADADGEGGEARDEVIGAVDGVDDPGAAVGVRAIEGDGVGEIAFFADEAVGGVALFEVGEDESLCIAIGVGDGLGVAFGESLDVAEVLEGDAAGVAGELDGELEVVGEGHEGGLRYGGGVESKVVGETMCDER